MNDLNVIDMIFLHGYDRPTMAYISKVKLSIFILLDIFFLLIIVNLKEGESSLGLRVYEVDHANNEFSKLLSSRDILDNQAFLIPGKINVL
jgi:hypothetical protein